MISALFHWLGDEAMLSEIGREEHQSSPFSANIVFQLFEGQKSIFWIFQGFINEEDEEKDPEKKRE